MTDAALSSARDNLTRLYRAAEPDVLKPLLARAALKPDARERVVGTARGLLADLRAAQGKGWVNRFLHEYRLNSTEGVALLSLAEAFLRVPDAETADLLIADKLGDADWKAHTGKSSSLLVNSATWGLVVGRALVGEGEAGPLRRLLNRAGEPFVRQAVAAAMKTMGEIFVMGRTIDEAMRRMRRADADGFTASFDMLGEAARTGEDASRYFASYKQAVLAVGRHAAEGHSISVKLSALHPRSEVAQYDRCVPELTARLEMMCNLAKEVGIHLTVDAEESEWLEMSLDIIAGVMRLPRFRGWDGFGMAVQAYSKRARATVAWAEALAAETGQMFNVRLVKGAYWDSEIKRTQVEGLADYPLFTRKAATDVSYLAVARDMLDAEHLRPAFASHNALTVATIVEWAGNRRDFEFQRLHGMGDGLYERLVREHGYHCRVYAPVGGHRDLLAYLVRRLLENGANSSFVHQLADERLGEAEILADPVAKVAAVGGARHPSIPLPRDLFGADGHRNSEGLDFSDRAVLARVAGVVSAAVDSGSNPVASEGSQFPGEGRGPVTGGLRKGTPSTPIGVKLDPGLRRGTADEKPGESQIAVADAITRAHAAFPTWAATPVDQRAAILDRLADLLEADRDALMALCVQEAGKTIPDSIGEIREAADFCRYYAAQARTKLCLVELPGPTGERNTLRLAPRGVWATIAPWNFPLAIFLGQTAAALVTGNTVVAKPAPQTPRIAARAVALAHESGVPRDALVLVTGGAEAGAALTGDARIAGVAFTGSTATARAIARSLLADDARPLVPLIAETGGINAMIVDSTALPEQVVADVVTSAFRSAGQRCSALRLLLVQEDVAQGLLHMLGGAMDTLRVGAPGDPATDVGPVIDRAAYERLMAHRERTRARWVKTVEVPEEGLFVPPTLIRLDRAEDLTAEWFGPLLHVATWRAGELGETIARVNAKGYGLTMALHSRIARAGELAEAEARVGNLYINRSMIGAVVGSQPFGGEGLSGTGPKAGGPHYLQRFCVERAVSVDTTSAGGNATLLSLDEGRM